MNPENLNYEYAFSDDILSEREAAELYKIERDFLESYASAKDMMTVEEWLPQELGKQLPEHSKEEIQEMSSDIIDSLKTTEEQKNSLQKAVDSGRSKESWLASTLVKSTSHMSAQESAKYLQSLDDTLLAANEAMYDTITTKAGLPNQNMNLDGFIAEQHHVNTYNLKAKSVGSDLHAEALKPKPGETYAKNSLDIAIKDSNGKIVKRYQAKYGATEKDTTRMAKDGDYRGQRLLVPEGQEEAVQKKLSNRKVSATIGDGDIKSKPLTKEQAKELQEQAQSGNWLEYDWNDYVAKDIALGIGKQAGLASAQGAIIGAGMTVASKAFHGEKIKGEDVVEAAIVSGADFGVKTAAAGALKTASEKGVLKNVIPKGKKGSNTVANVAFVAVENIKIAGKVATGELTAREGIDQMQQTTASCVAGIAASTKGAAIGASVGSVIGPVGTAIGGFVGGAVGYMAGSKVGQTVVKGYQKVRDTVKSTVKTAVTSVKNTVKSVGSSIKSKAKRLFGF